MITSIKYQTLLELFSSVRNDQDSLVRARDYQKKVKSAYQEGEHKGDRCFIDSLNDQLTLRKGYVYCVSGYPSAGKSEFVNYLAILQAMKAKKKIGLYSPENYPIHSLVVTLMKSYLGKNISKGFSNQCSKEEFDTAFEFINEHFSILRYTDMPRLSQLLEAYQRLAMEQGVEMFITDPFNSIVEGASRDSTQLQVALTQMKMFAENMEVYNLIVEHPIKPVLTKSGELPECSPWMLYGGSMWWNKMDCIVVIARNLFDNSPEVKVRTWKMKLQRLNGIPGEQTIYFDVMTGRYYDNRSSKQTSLDNNLGGYIDKENKIDRYDRNENSPF